MKQKLFTILTLLLCLCSTAWADDVTVTFSGSTTKGTNTDPLTPTISVSDTKITTGTAASVCATEGYIISTVDDKSVKLGGTTTYYLGQPYQNKSKKYWKDAGANFYGTFTIPSGYTYTVKSVSHALAAVSSSNFTAVISIKDATSTKYASNSISVASKSSGATINATTINLAEANWVTLPEGTYTINVTPNNTTDASTGKYFGVAQVVLTGDFAPVATGDYTITKGSATNGSITVKGKADKDEVVDITATPNTGYSFNSWNIYKTGDAETTISPAAASASTTFTMPAYDVTVDATFSAIDYAITHGATEHGTYTIKVGDADAVSGNTTANYGQTITLSATPEAGYAVLSWGVTDEDSNPVTVTDNQFTMPAKAVTIAPTIGVVPDVTISNDLEDSYSMVINTKKTFTIAASGGTGEYTYQWYQNSTASTEGATAISGKTSASYELNPTSAYDNYIFCVATSSVKSATSNIAHVTAAAITPSYRNFNGTETIVATTSNNFATQLAQSWMCDGDGGGAFTYDDTGFHKNGSVKIYPQLGKTSTEEIASSTKDCINVKKNVSTNTLVTYVTGVSGVKVYTAPTGSSHRGVYVYAKENGTGDNVAEAIASLNYSEKPLTYLTTLVGLDPTKNYAIYYVGVDNASTNNASNHMIAALKFNPTPDETLTLNASGYSTFSNQNSVAFSGATAYKAALDFANNKITCTATSNNEAPAGAGVLLYGDNGASVDVFYTGSLALEGNNLKGTTTSTGALVEKGSNDYYALSGNTFKKYTGDAFVAKKAYFEVASGTVLSHEFTISFDNETTGINGIEEVAPKTMKTRKVVKNGRLVIETANGEFTIDGARVK